MNTSRIDIANMVLMFFACAAAFVLPFEVFLFSYAVLGPLHYLTEISWLHKRNYFALGKWDYIPFVVIGVLLFLFSFVFKEYANFTTTLIFLSFLLRLGNSVLLKDVFYKIALVAVPPCFWVRCCSTKLPVHLSYSGSFFPTLIHVFLFTGLFILYGALKSKSKTGYLSLGRFLPFVHLSFFVVQPQFAFYQVSSYAEKALQDSGFVQLNKSIIELFKLGAYTLARTYSNPQQAWGLCASSHLPIPTITSTGFRKPRLLNGIRCLENSWQAFWGFGCCRWLCMHITTITG
jgi:hypothetical protein